MERAEMLVAARSLGICWLALVVAPAAYGLDFDYGVERFEVSGQVAFVDEFGDGVVAPWAAAFGTVQELGGELSLESPGDPLLALSLLGGPPLEVSNAVAPGAANVADGAGSFVVSSTWNDLPGPPAGPLGGFYAVQLFATLPSAAPVCASLAIAAGEPAVLEIVAATLALRDFGSTVPPFTGPPGLVADANLTRTCVGGTTDPTDNRVYLRSSAQVVSIDPLDVTGSVVLQLGFSDIDNSIAPSFSVDSGSSFVPMTAIAAFDDFTASTGRFQLIAQPIETTGLPGLSGWGTWAAALAIVAVSGLTLGRRGRPDRVVL